MNSLMRWAGTPIAWVNLYWPRLVLLGDGHHQAQVGLDERLDRLVAVTDYAAHSRLRTAVTLWSPSSSARAQRPASAAWGEQTSSSL
jgi:hypothetical protein